MAACDPWLRAKKADGTSSSKSFMFDPKRVLPMSSYNQISLNTPTTESRVPIRGSPLPSVEARLVVSTRYEYPVLSDGIAEKVSTDVIFMNAPCGARPA